MLSELKHISIDLISHQQNEMRSYVIQESLDDLTDSIKELGVLQPLRLLRHGAKPDCTYTIIFGNRRFMAAKAAGLVEVPATIVTEAVDRGAAEMLAENLHREDVNPMDLGTWLAKLKEEKGLTMEAVGKMFGRSASWANTYIALTRCDENIKAAVETGKIDPVSARRIMSIKDIPIRDNLLMHATKSGATQDTIKGWVAREQIAAGERPAAPPVSGALDQATDLPPLTFTCFSCHDEKQQEDMIIARLCPNCYGELKEAIQLMQAVNDQEEPTKPPEEEPCPPQT